MRYPDHVRVVEVGLRDGLQSESAFIETAGKIAVGESAASAGVAVLEATSFVHPAAIPQLADAEAVIAGLSRRPGVRYAALVPNCRGAERALLAGVDEVRFAVMTSETFNQRNVGMSVRGSMEQAVAAAALLRRGDSPVRLVGLLGTCFGCPFEGDVDSRRILALVGEWVAIGAAGVTLCDTTGMANPLQVARLAGAVRDRWPELEVNLHFHNTRGMGLANVLGGLEAGVTGYEASLGGLGGCPFAPRATGNISTEDMVHMMHEMEIETGVNLEQLLAAAALLEGLVGRELPGQVLRAGPRSCLHRG